MALRVKLTDIFDALEMVGDEVSAYLDTQTGEVRTIHDEEMRLAEDGGDDFAADWQREAVEAAREVLEHPDRWLELPDRFEIHEWAAMERFAQSQAPALAEELGDAVHGRGAFRHFKAVVRRRGVEPQWYQFRDEHYAQVARDWLRGHEIELE